jgi:hypothetical protein
VRFAQSLHLGGKRASRSLRAREAQALPMQPQKDITVPREHAPTSRPLIAEAIVRAVAPVIEQHGRKRPGTRRTPDLCTQRQRSTSDLDHFRRGFRLASCYSIWHENGDDDTHHMMRSTSRRGPRRVPVRLASGVNDRRPQSDSRWPDHVATTRETRYATPAAV